MTTRADPATGDAPTGTDSESTDAPEHATVTGSVNDVAPQDISNRDGDAEATGSAPARGPWRVAAWVQRRIGLGTIAFVLIAGVFGIVFCTVTPPFWGHDEITQFGRTYQVAHGGFTPQRITDDRGPAYGGEIPLSIDGLMTYAFEDYNRKPDEPAPLAADRTGYRLLGSAPVTTATKPMWFTNTAAYSPIPYLPGATGVRLAQAFDLNVSATLTLTRLAGLLAYLILIGLGLRALRGFRIQWLILAVAVLPIAIFQAGSVTADTVTNGLAVLLSCLLVKGLFLKAPLTRFDTALALATTVLLPLSKPAYVPLALLVVLIPARQYGFGKALRWIPWVCAALGVALFGAWMKIAAPTGDGMGLMRPAKQWHSVRPGDQLHGILSDPVHFTNIFADSIWYRDQRWFTQFFGELGFAYIDVPALSVVACLLAFVVGLGIAERSTANRWRTALTALIVLGNVAMIYVTLYMSFSPVGYYLIDGVQGRYFVPLAIVGFALLLRWMPLRLTDTRGRIPVRGPAITIVAATVVALTAAVIKYNFLVWG